MEVFWDVLIARVVELLDPKTIIEIGSEFGGNTTRVLSVCAPHGRTLHSIDPHPQFDIDGLKRQYGDAFQPHLATSLEALPTLREPYELVLIDGDHNWYTVINELRAIAEHTPSQGGRFPLVLLHDIGWPYGRRDLYYFPETIPQQYRHPFRKAGMLPGTSELVSSGGYAPDLYNADHEHGERNGVLTAIEDFLDETDLELRLISVPIWHGLGIIYAQHHLDDRPELAALFSQLQLDDVPRRLIEGLDADHVNLKLEHARYRRRVERLDEQIATLEPQLHAAQATIKERDRQLSEARDKLLQQEKRLGALAQSNAQLRRELQDARPAATEASAPASARRNAVPRSGRADGNYSLLKRRLTKLRQNPEKFLRDSRFAVLRQLAPSPQAATTVKTETVSSYRPRSRTPLVHIVVAARDTTGATRAGLERLLQSTGYSHYAVTLVDPSPRSSLPPSFELCDHQVSVVSANGSLAAGCNQAVASSNAEMLLFVEHGIEASAPDWLSTLVDELQPHSKTAAIGPRLLAKDQSTLSAGVDVEVDSKTHSLVDVTEERDDKPSRYTAALNGACLLVRSEAFLGVGGFDEQSGDGQMDVDLCLRLHGAGFDLYHCADVTLIHKASTAADLDQRRGRDRNRLIERWRNRTAINPATAEVGTQPIPSALELQDRLERAEDALRQLRRGLASQPAKPKPAPRPAAPSNPLARKFRKLRRDPVRFFRDARNKRGW